ncbi:MAG: zinc-dependent alcohol dehydrogenase family protein [Planctomycetes bacterium]|jgi:alcohol dehydrogenase|nr:zinc-dependent alcohol dehydrogenase family protein [Planctomycetota bacterium]
MRALVYLGRGRIGVEERPQPTVQRATDAVVRIVRSTICGTDLHILKGDVATCSSGRILGHEGTGVVESVGAAVVGFAPGDRVLISCITACGLCPACRQGMPSHCATGGWILGNTIDGTQADFVRIPHATSSLHALPADVDDEAAVMLSDILPTGFECGVANGRIAPGGTVAIVGSGPIGLATLLTAQFYTPSRIIMIDLDDHRLEVARALGATDVVNSATGDAAAAVQLLTDGRGVDTAIEAVGVPDTFRLCERIVAAGGVIANIGVHGKPVELHLETLWSHNVTITTRLVDAVSTPMLLRTVRAHRLDPRRLVTHRFPMHDILAAYDTFGRAAATKALKVVLEA